MEKYLNKQLTLNLSKIKMKKMIRVKLLHKIKNNMIIIKLK